MLCLLLLCSFRLCIRCKTSAVEISLNAAQALFLFHLFSGFYFSFFLLLALPLSEVLNTIQILGREFNESRERKKDGRGSETERDRQDVVSKDHFVMQSVAPNATKSLHGD